MLRVSVIIPAFKAQATIGRAVASIQKAGIPMNQIQIVVAPDDKQDYGFLSCQTKSLTFVPSHAIGSGAGPSAIVLYLPQQATTSRFWMLMTLGSQDI